MTHAELALMPTAEKMQLMESIWESLDHREASTSITPAWHAEVLHERSQALDQCQEPIAAWSDAKQRIRDQIARR